MESVDPQAWETLLAERGVDVRIRQLIRELAARRTLEPPTLDTAQLLIAQEPDGYAAGRVAGATLSLFFDSARARDIAEKCALSAGRRSEATWIVRVPAKELETQERQQLIQTLFEEALDRVAPLGAWQRGLPDQTKKRGELCPVHFVQRSVSGVCEMCVD